MKVELCTGMIIFLTPDLPTPVDTLDPPALFYNEQLHISERCLTFISLPDGVAMALQCESTRLQPAQRILECRDAESV